ncbi:MAG TPA: CinA family protein [Methanomassiliicoccales archaeon]|nr:CinA family protein [Methanomassiliicoccales archaeon]
MLETDVLYQLRRAGLTLAVAESCTGGRICDRLTDVPGSSEHFKGGIVAYSNDSKVRFLDVSRDTLKEHGAVSEETAKEMAAGVAKAFDADIGISVTGIAGPGGATPQKPVGLVYVGLAWKKERLAFKFLFDGDRKSVKAQATEQALQQVLNFIP